VLGSCAVAEAFPALLWRVVLTSCINSEVGLQQMFIFVRLAYYSCGQRAPPIRRS
jgi:hypothetical protein